MSEAEVRQTLVGPTGKCLKFLNNKNNLENMYLQKRLQTFEREKSYSISQLDNNKIDTIEFMKHIKKREPDSQQTKKLLDRSEMVNTPEPVEVRMEAKRKGQRTRKVRLAQTAPASMQHKHKKVEKQDKDVVKDVFARNPKLKQDRSMTTLETNRRRSLYLLISGKAREEKFDDSDDEENNKKDLPRPSPRTMLDVMIGLNAFSHVPPPRYATRSPDEPVDHRDLLTGRSSINSVYDSTENIAEKFIEQWRSRIASRRQSIYDKLTGDKPNPDTITASMKEARLLSSVPEAEKIRPSSVRCKSKWTMTHKPSTVKHSCLPGIRQSEDLERRQLFQAWIEEKKDELKSCEKLKSGILNPTEKTDQRRQSFMNFLKERNLSKSKDDEVEGSDNIPKCTDPYEVDDGPLDIGDMMKTILNIKQKFKDPLDFRLNKFYKELDRIKEKDKQAQGPLTKKGIKRRWKLLMKGIDAALADSSDEEDNDLHTV